MFKIPFHTTAAFISVRGTNRFGDFTVDETSGVVMLCIEVIHFQEDDYPSEREIDFFIATEDGKVKILRICCYCNLWHSFCC